MKIINYQCKCGSSHFFTEVKGTASGLYCSECGKWQKWLNKDELRAFKNDYALSAVSVENLPQTTVKKLVAGEWVDGKELLELGLSFKECWNMFEFNRTVEWNPPPLNGQKSTVLFRLKQPEITVSAEEIANNVKQMANCFKCPLHEKCDSDKGCYETWMKYLTGKDVEVIQTTIPIESDLNKLDKATRWYSVKTGNYPNKLIVGRDCWMRLVQEIQRTMTMGLTTYPDGSKVPLKEEITNE